MTPSTEHASGAMSGIVETVAAAIDNIVFAPGVNTHGQSKRAAQAAIRTTIEYLRDNVSEAAAMSVWSAIISSMQEGPSPSHGEAILRAGLIASLEEFELSEIDHSKTPEVTR